MELKVGRQIGATQDGAAQDLGKMLITGETILTLGQQQGDIGIVGTGHRITHKLAGIRVDHADTLVIANLTFDRFRPVTDHATGTR